MAEVQEKGAELVRDFSKVILTLDNVLIPDEKIYTTPSMEDGLEADVETDLRILGCELIQVSGILLKLPQVAMATGQVLFQRFYYSKSFVKHTMETLAMACVNVASKIEECPRRIRDVVNVFHNIKQIRGGKIISPLILDQNYINLKNQVIKSERRVLKELGFCVHVKHPHKIIVTYLQVLESEHDQRLAQMAWNYMNDSFRTNVFVRYDPETIACACIYLAARKLQKPLPNSPSWHSLFGIQVQELQDISIEILKLYGRKKPNADYLEKVVNEAKKLHIEAKLKAKGMASEGFTPNSNSRPATPSKASPNPTNPAMKRVKAEGEHSSHSSFGDNLDNHVSRKKRSHSRSTHSRSRSLSRSRSFSPRGSPNSHLSDSPPSSKYRKNVGSRDKYYREKEKTYRGDVYDRDRDYPHDSGRDRVRDHDSYSSTKHKRRRRTPTYSPVDMYSRSPDSRSKNHKKYYKEKERAKSRSRSRDRDRHRSSKKRNGHHGSHSRERYRR